MAAAAQLATVFLETSLGTRLVVSFPASATTVSDLKRQVTAEHAACFPQSGPIAVESFKVKHGGSLFHLTDSMVVEGAFRWVQGPWSLMVDARQLGSHPHPLACGKTDCGSAGDSEQSSDIPVISDSTKNMSLPAVSHGAGIGNLAVGDGVSNTPLLNQLDENHEVVECASHQLGDATTVPQQSSDDHYLASGGSGTSSMDQQDRSHEGVEKHAMGQQKDGIGKTMLQECSDSCLAAGGSDIEKAVLQESSDLGLVAGQSDSRAKDRVDKSHEDVERAFSQCKDANVKIMLQGSSSLDVAAGEGKTPPSVNQHKNSVKHASGQHTNGNVKTMFQKNSDLDVAGGGGETAPMNHLDKPCESVNHDGSGQCENGNVNTMPEQSSDFDVDASEREASPLNQLDKSHEGVRYASVQLEDGTANIMLGKGSDLDESAAAKVNGGMRDQHQDVIAEPGGTQLFQNQKGDKNDEITIGKRDENISFVASSTVNIKLAVEKKRIEPENLNSNPMAYSQGNCSHDMGEKPYHEHKEPWTSKVCNGETNNGVSGIPPCDHSMDRGNSSNREVSASDKDEPWVTGLYPGESSFKETDVPHCFESMKEGNKKQINNRRFLKKRKHEGTEHESCPKTRRQRIITVRKLPMSKAAKIYGVRC